MVKWTDHAKVQLHSVYEHISPDSPLYAKRVTEALVKKTIGLDELPRIGRKVPELKLQFEAVSKLDSKKQEALKTVINGILFMHDAKRYTDRANS